MNQVSVIIPSYNNARWLPACIQSCLDQGERLKEVIVVDDGSTDNSRELTETFAVKYPGVVKLFINPAKGGNNARNYGFEQSCGEYIQWLDSDDVLLPGKFDAQATYLDRHTGTDIVYSDWQKDFYMEGDDVPDHTDVIKKSPVQDYLEQLLRNKWTSPNNYLMKREMAQKLHQAQGWNPATKVEQDREYFTVAGILGARFSYVSGCFAVYNRWSTSTVSGMSFENRLEWSVKLSYSFLTKIRSSTLFTPRQMKVYEKIIKTEWVNAKYYNRQINFPERVGWSEVEWFKLHVRQIPVIMFSSLNTK